jgi:hypothetical protein
MGIPMTIWIVLCLSNSATVRRSTAATTSLLAKVWRLQCQVYPSSALVNWSARRELHQWRRQILDKESVWVEARSTCPSRW